MRTLDGITSASSKRDMVVSNGGTTIMQAPELQTSLREVAHDQLGGQ